MENQTTNQIAKNFHAFDHQYDLVGIEIDMLTEEQFSVKNKT